jgi:hypothetical protein
MAIQTLTNRSDRGLNFRPIREVVGVGEAGSSSSPTSFWNPSKSESQMDEIETDTAGYVVVVAEHPVIGRVFWAYFDESNVNAPDYFGFTLSIQSASWIPIGWRNDRNLSGGGGSRGLAAWQAHIFLHTIFDEHRLGSEYRANFDAAGKLTDQLLGGLEQLRLQSKQSTQDFIRWIWATEWSDVPTAFFSDE